MATGTVSSVTGDVWQLISSVTASGSSVNFSSLSGYKKYLVVGRAVYTASGNNYALVINDDTTAGDYTYNSGNSAFIQIGSGTSSATGNAFWATIDDADKAIPHEIQAKATANTNWAKDYFVTTSAVTKITVTTVTADTFSGGTISLYGIAS
jgi:hypothetical protein